MGISSEKAMTLEEMIEFTLVVGPSVSGITPKSNGQIFIILEELLYSKPSIRFGVIWIWILEYL